MKRVRMRTCVLSACAPIGLSIALSLSLSLSLSPSQKQKTQQARTTLLLPLSYDHEKRNKLEPHYYYDGPGYPGLSDQVSSLVVIARHPNERRYRPMDFVLQILALSSLNFAKKAPPSPTEPHGAPPSPTEPTATATEREYRRL